MLILAQETRFTTKKVRLTSLHFDHILLNQVKFGQFLRFGSSLIKFLHMTRECPDWGYQGGSKTAAPPVLALVRLLLQYKLMVKSLAKSEPKLAIYAINTHKITEQSLRSVWTTIHMSGRNWLKDLFWNPTRKTT